MAFDSRARFTAESCRHGKGAWEGVWAGAWGSNLWYVFGIWEVVDEE